MDNCLRLKKRGKAAREKHCWDSLALGTGGRGILGEQGVKTQANGDISVVSKKKQKRFLYRFLNSLLYTKLAKKHHKLS